MAVPVDHGEPGRRGAVDPGISVAGRDLSGDSGASPEAGGGLGNVVGSVEDAG